MEASSTGPRFQQIIDNVTKRELSTTSLISAVTSARNYMQSIGADGAWADIDYATTVKKDVFKMWLSHGIKPTGGSYVSNWCNSIARVPSTPR